jgi:RNA polymerase sigma-70 factor (ECF subfamily)
LSGDESELELIKKLRTGDPSAFHRLVDRFGNRLYGLAFSLLNNAEDAEDVVQETLSGAYRSIGSFQQRASLWTWLVKILVRQAARSRRSLDARSQKLRLGSPLEDLERGGQLPPGIHEPMRQTDAKMDVMAMLEKLAPDQQEIIILRELEQLSYDQISQSLGIPLGTVESRLYRARAELRQLLRGYAGSTGR